MDNPKPDSKLAAEPADTADETRVSPAGDPAEHDPLIEILERWEERYFQHEDPSPESLGVHDSALVKALLDRINQRKRLYSFLGVSTEEAAEDANSAPDVVSVRTERPETPSDTVVQDHPREPAAAQADPPSIGRYQVIRVLGQGAFGRVYLARDANLERLVAIKVPTTQPAADSADLEAALSEPRILARLSHANIVPVYDVGHTNDGRWYVVSKYIDGGDLAARLARGRPSFSESAELVAALCGALHHAHTQDLFHRDVKPANILLDAGGTPYLADFGLALKDEDFGEGARLMGTAAYTSPEQARGEGHLVDGRSDIFSLGIVFYELLTCRRPFRGDSIQEILRQVISTEARPPRQIDDTVPRELERICLKALSKRAGDRYSTARDFEEDLRHYLKSAGKAPSPEPAGRPLPAWAKTTTPQQMASTASATPVSTDRPVRIVPKGLCCFDEHDADFFLELLPGPRDRDGLPDGLRFWKTRIESTDPDKSFRVGLIYGPSGCGKSSLVRAGLLPLLGRHVRPVYVEATPAETESHLLRAIRKAVPALPGDGSLVESLMGLRRGAYVPRGCKLLLVLDQFEQWLFARRLEENTELVAALRQCDGEKLQALCLVRDEFWLPATRFARDLESDLVPDQNIAAVDLFEPKHARSVLAAFGRAYRALPEEGQNLTRDQSIFLDQAATALAEDGRVAPVRLALFAEMIKGKPWTPATMRDVGGMEGVGTKFLEETFSSARSSPRYRYHQKAARAILKALLPEPTADLKGQMRSIDELRHASGYAERPTQFRDLIRILDSDLRLITPVDLESSMDEDEPAAVPASGRYYRLTHDYLVAPLRDWLTRRQRQTPEGRAELLLEERSALWNARPENRHLPSAWEWAKIRRLTRKKDWTGSQRTMMKQASRVHGRRGILAIAFLTVGMIAAFAVRRQIIENRRAIEATALVKQVLGVDTPLVPNIIHAMRDYRRLVDPALRSAFAEAPQGSREKLHASLALLPVDTSQVDYLFSRMLGASPDELSVLRLALLPFQSTLTEKLWIELENDRGESPLQAAGALALYDDQHHERWAKSADKVAREMVAANPIRLNAWRGILRPVKNALRIPLSEIFQDSSQPETDRVRAATYLVDYVADSPKALVELLMDADPKSYSIVFPVVQKGGPAVLAELRRVFSTPRASAPGASSRAEHGSERHDQASLEDVETANDRWAARRARAAVALVHLGLGSEVWHLLEHSSDPRLRSALIGGLYAMGADPAILADELHRLARDAATDPKKAGLRGNANAYLDDPAASKKRALILALAGYRKESLGSSARNELVETLSMLYRDDPDAGVHSAAELLLARWGYHDRLKLAADPARTGETRPRRWYVNRTGHTMVQIDAPVEFAMGSPPDDPDREDEEVYHRRRIDRPFAIATREVTVDQFQKFAAEKRGAPHAYNARFSPGRDTPQNSVSWYDAAAYCNWLSEQDGLSREEWCYLPNDHDQYDQGMTVPADVSRRTGYRLPTEAEMEYACRAGAITSRYYGHSPDLLASYEWYVENSNHRAHPCGTLLPNDLGCFDMLGNIMEWCHDRFSEVTPGPDRVVVDLLTNEVVLGEKRYLRSATFEGNPIGLRSADRRWFDAFGRKYDIGFRPARSIR
jgi:serine/threonine protein kinase/formylglycine-generating enzyme required for sulfatase activity